MKQLQSDSVILIDVKVKFFVERMWTTYESFTWFNNYSIFVLAQYLRIVHRTNVQTFKIIFCYSPIFHSFGAVSSKRVLWIVGTFFFNIIVTYWTFCKRLIIKYKIFLFVSASRVLFEMRNVTRAM